MLLEYIHFGAMLQPLPRVVIDNAPERVESAVTSGGSQVQRPVAPSRAAAVWVAKPRPDIAKRQDIEARVRPSQVVQHPRARESQQAPYSGHAGGRGGAAAVRDVRLNRARRQAAAEEGVEGPAPGSDAGVRPADGARGAPDAGSPPGVDGPDVHAERAPRRAGAGRL